MYSIKFECEVITPMFMAGADGKTPELRTSEFKGMMRWWWRAIKAEDDIDKLREEEAKIFGGTGEKEGRSKVKIKVFCSNLESNIGNNLKLDYNLNWRFDKTSNSLIGEDAGIGYLLYSTVLLNRERSYIKPGYLFELKLSSFTKNEFKQALAALWLSIYLGGFGTRARRGGGNIIVLNNPENDFGLDFITKGNTSKEIANWIIENLKKACKMITGDEKPEKFAVSYSNLSFSRFIISKKNFTSWSEALHDIGKIFMDFRTRHKKEIFDSAVFGLPVLHRSSDTIVLGGNFDKNNKIKEKIERRSSPLWIKVIKSQGKFYWMVLRLSGEFLEEGKVLLNVERKNSTIKDSQKPDYRLIDEFWNVLKNDYGEEFILSKPKVLDNIIEKIKKETNPKKIILFGSRARGDAYKKSDIDIAVDIDRPLSFPELNIDIVNLNKVDQKLHEKIKKEGVIIYERKG